MYHGMLAKLFIVPLSSLRENDLPLSIARPVPVVSCSRGLSYQCQAAYKKNL